MNVFQDGWSFLSTAANWHGTDGIPHRLIEHSQYTLIAMVIAAAIALPLGLITGHANRGGIFVAALANAARALPTLGILILLVVVMGIGYVPVMIPLVALAVPAILLNTYEGIRTVDPRTTDAARGMGMNWWQVLSRVELPAAMPLIIVGLRTAAVQVVATATIAAQVSFGGVGRFIIDGLAQRDYNQVAGGALLAGALAVVTLFIFAGLRLLLVSPGVRSQR